MKKAQGISVNVIIIAAIAILVLVILAVLLLRSAREQGTATACEGLGGTCTSSCENLPGLYGPSPARCSIQGEVCCIPILDETN